jgi:hypothetical protein
MAFADLLEVGQTYISGVERFNRRASTWLVFGVTLALLLAGRLVAAFLDARKFFLTFLECAS